MTQVSSQLSSLLFVHSLSLLNNYKLPTGEEDVDSTLWLEHLLVWRRLRFWRRDLYRESCEPLVVEDMATEVLPELITLCLNEYLNSPSLSKAAEQFVATRRLSGRTVYLADGGRATRYTQPCSKSNSCLMYFWV